MGKELFRTSFLRSVLEALQRQTGGKARAQLDRLLPEHLRPLLNSQVLNSKHTEVLISLDDAEEFLLAVDRCLGDGSGSTLEAVGKELATHSYFSADGLLTRGNLTECVRHLGATLERPFVDVQTRFDLNNTDTGFALSLGVVGRPRATRILRHLASGFIRASFTFALEATRDQLRLFATTVGDRGEIIARYREADESSDVTPPPSSRERPRMPPRPSVAQEVERILSNAPRSNPPRSAPPRAAGFDATPVPGSQRIPGAPRLPQIVVHSGAPRNKKK